MPKKENIMWEHLKKLQRKPNTPYFICICKYCDECDDEPLEMEGRIKTMENHLKKCEHYRMNQTSETASAAASCSSTGAASSIASSRKRDADSDQSIMLTDRNLWKSRKIMNYMDRALTKSKALTMRKRLVEMVADSSIPFMWIE